MKKEIMLLINEGKFDDACEIADEYFDSYDLDKAEEIYKEIYLKVIENSGSNSKEAIFYKKKLASVCYEKHDYTAALPHYYSILEWYIKCGAESSMSALEAMLDLASVYNHLEKYEDVLKVCIKAYEIASEVYGGKSFMACRIIRETAECFTALGKYQDAADCFEKLLDIYEESDEDYVEDIALTYNELAMTYKYMGLPLKAKKTYEKGIEIIENSTDANSEKLLLLMLNDLCGLYDRLSMSEEELSLRKYILERAEKIYGSEHYNVHIAKSNLGNAYVSHGEYKKAAEIFEEHYIWALDKLGEEDSETIRTETLKAGLLEKMGHYRKAKDMFEKIYMHRSMVFGKYNVETMISAENVAYCLIDLKDYMTARKIFEKTAAFFKENYGENSDYFYSLSGYTYACALLGEYPEALNTADKLDNLSLTFEEQENTNELDYFRGIAYKGMREYEKAEKCHRRYLESVVKKHGEKHPETLSCKYELASILYDRGEHEKALEICKALAEIYENDCQVQINKLKNDILLARAYLTFSDSDRASSIIHTVLEAIDKNEYPDEYSEACSVSERCFSNRENSETSDYT